MRLLLGLFIIVTATGAQADHGVELKAGIGYDTNVYYAQSGEKSDATLILMPSWHKLYEASNFYRIAPDLDLEYTKYFAESSQDYFEYRLKLKNSFKMFKKLFLELTPKTELASEPAYITGSDSKKRSDRLQRTINGGTVALNYYKDERRQILSQMSYEQESFDQSRYAFQENTYYNGTLYYKKYFLPETFFYFGYRGAFKKYPNSKNAPIGRTKYDHTRYEPGFGVEGRLNRYFKLRSYLGYTILKYKGDKGFANPVVLVEVEEELSPKDMLVMGYQTTAEDSYFGNYAVEQKLYLGYGRLYGDQLFLNAKIEYSYKNFIGLTVRDDQRLVGILSAEYSQNERVKYELKLDYNQLESNAINPTRTDYLDPVDPPASFDRIGAGVFMKYLF